MFANTPFNVILHDEQRIYPEEGDIPKILYENHDSVIGGHGGIKKTYYRIINKYHWPKMLHDITSYIKNCSKCQINKISRHPTKMPMVITDTPERFNDKIGMDIVGPFTITERRNQYLLTIQDCLTKLMLAIPLKDCKTQTVIDAFLKNYVCYYGIPKNILTDRGTNFTSNLMKEFEKQIGITHVLTTAFHPESNGSLERSHQVLKDFLRNMCNEDKDNWDEMISFAVLNHNISNYESTQKTTYELVFGRTARDVSKFCKKNP